MSSSISPIQRDPDQRQRLVEAFSQALPVPASVVGLVEIGSYSKDEAVPSSDSDTRAYIRAAHADDIIVMADALDTEGFTALKAARGRGAVHPLSYIEFNDRLHSCLGGVMANHVSAGFIDVAHAEFLFQNLGHFPTQDHSMLFQSAIVYDRYRWVADWRAKLTGVVTPTLVGMYRAQVRTRTNERLPTYAADPGTCRGADQWLLQAVRCIREATSLRSFSTSGRFVFRRRDVLAAVASLSAPTRLLITQLYEWKCDPAVRQAIVASVAHGDSTWPQRYAELTPAVQMAVAELLAGVPPGETGPLEDGH